MNAIWLFIAFVVLTVGLTFGLLFAHHWLAVHTGTVPVMCGQAPCADQPYYGFWSGFGSDLGEATLVSAVVVGLYTGIRKVNCHTKGCWRIGHHPLDGTPYILCKHHHPEVPSEGATHEHILAHHARVKGHTDE